MAEETIDSLKAALKEADDKLKDAQKAHKKEVADFKKQLEEKDAIIAELNEENATATDKKSDLQVVTYKKKQYQVLVPIAKVPQSNGSFAIFNAKHVEDDADIIGDILKLDDQQILKPVK